MPVSSVRKRKSCCRLHVPLSSCSPLHPGHALSFPCVGKVRGKRRTPPLRLLSFLLRRWEGEQTTLLLTDEKMGEQEKIRKLLTRHGRQKAKGGEKGMSHMIDLLSPTRVAALSLVICHSFTFRDQLLETLLSLGISVAFVI